MYPTSLSLTLSSTESSVSLNSFPFIFSSYDDFSSSYRRLTHLKYRSSTLSSAIFARLSSSQHPARSFNAAYSYAS